jgi:ATP-dependent protease HslVU (ClpYQ) peptidase subunit
LLDNVIEHLYKSNHKLMENRFADRSEVFSFFLELYNEMKKSYTLVDSGKDTYASFYNVFLAVTPTRIFGVNANLSVHEYEHFAVRGAGSDYALGCLYGTYHLFEDGFEIARMALEAACHFSIYCKEPLDIIEVTNKGFAKSSRNGHKALGGALTTLPIRKGVGDLIAIARSADLPSKGKSQAKKKRRASVPRAGAARNNSSGKRKGRRK